MPTRLRSAPDVKVVFLPEVLPWRQFVAPGVVQNDDKSLQMSFRLHGPDLSGQSDEVRGQRMLQANNAIRRLGRGCAFFTEARRLQITPDEYPPSTCTHPVAQRSDDERRADFLRPGRHFRSDYILTFRYQPPSSAASQLEDFFLEGESPIATTSERATIATFRMQALHLASLLGGARSFTPLTDAETKTYLHSTVSWKRHKVGVSERSSLHLRLVDCDFQCGYDLKLGPLYLQVISITDLPDESVPGLLAGLDDLSFEYRWMTRYIALPKPKARALMKQVQVQHYGQRIGWLQRIVSSVIGSSTPIQDTDSLNKSNAVDQARQEIGADLTGFGYFTDVLVIADRDASMAMEKAEIVQELINDRECSCRIEGLNAEDAWYGSHPGNVHHNLLRPMESSLNRVHTMPGLMQVWTGTPWNDHLKAPALLHVTTAESTPFHVSTHPKGSDVANALVLGPMGKGKTTLLSLMVLAWQQYVGGRVVILDVKRGLRAVTLCLGGQSIDLGTAGPSLQPLGDLDTTAAYDRAETWCTDRLTEAELPLTAERRAYVRVGLAALKALRRSQRTISRLLEEWKIFTGEMLRPQNGGLRAKTDDGELRRRMDLHHEIWSVFERFRGGLLDGDHDWLMDAPIQHFEWETLLETPELITPTISYLWQRLEDGFQGQPTLFLCDEFNRLMLHESMLKRVDKALRLYRFRNVAFVAATQFVEDILDIRLGSMLVQSCPTRFLLPNPAALSQNPRKAYEALDVTDEQIHIIAQAREKEECFFVSPDGARLFRWKLSGTTLDVCGRASLDHQRRMDRLLAEHGLEHFWEPWLQSCQEEDIDTHDASCELGVDHAADQWRLRATR